MVIKFVKSSTIKKIFFEYIQSINGILGLTYRESEILAELFKEVCLALPDNPQLNIADTSFRKKIIENCRISKENLSRFFKKFRTKGILVRDFDDLYLNPKLIPDLTDNEITISIVINVKNESK